MTEAEHRDRNAVIAVACGWVAINGVICKWADHFQGTDQESWICPRCGKKWMSNAGAICKHEDAPQVFHDKDWSVHSDPPAYDTDYDTIKDAVRELGLESSFSCYANKTCSTVTLFKDKFKVFEHDFGRVELEVALRDALWKYLKEKEEK